MRLRSIRVRLTAWYLAMLALGLGIFGVGNWYGMRASAFHTVDEELEDRIRGVQTFLQHQEPARSLSEIGEEFRNFRLDPAVDLLQVSDENGSWLYRSPVLEKGGVTIRRTADLDAEPVYEVLTVQGAPIRFATSRVTVRGHPFAVQAAESLREFFEALDRFRLLLWWLTPGLLIVAGAGGYWISRRALQPVDRITAAAESISIHNLAGQLKVPESADELQRLSETLNRMLGRLNESVQRMSQFTADASHELRAPISVIRATAELAVQGPRTSAEFRDDMSAILTEAERVSRLIDSLLLLARADAGEDGLQRELVEVSASLREAVEQCLPPATGKQIQLSSNAGDQLVVVWGDAEALRRLFFILIDNAVKYTPEGGRIDVRLEVSAGRAAVSVTDTGIGIAAADLPHIFDRFWRADKVRSRGTGGDGLGLAIATWIVDRHQGTVEPGAMPHGGSRFTVTIPCVEVRGEQ